MPPTTQYPRSGDVTIACRLFGTGPLDLVVTPGAIAPWHDGERRVR